jgi:hypothetical protein
MSEKRLCTAPGPALFPRIELHRLLGARRSGNQHGSDRDRDPILDHRLDNTFTMAFRAKSIHLEPR